MCYRTPDLYSRQDLRVGRRVHGNSPEGCLQACHHQCGPKAFTGNVADGDAQPGAWQMQEITVITADRVSLAARCAVIQVLDSSEIFMGLQQYDDPT